MTSKSESRRSTTRPFGQHTGLCCPQKLRLVYFESIVYSRSRVYVHLSLKLLSTWLSLTNKIKPRVRRINQMFRIWNPQSVVSESNSIIKYGLGIVMGHWQIVYIQIGHRRTWRLIRVCTVCLNYRKLRAKWKSPFGTIFPSLKSVTIDLSVLSVLWCSTPELLSHERTSCMALRI